MYIRPEWTCGRYNSENRIAIVYNLLSGIVYLFEDESADVICYVLKCKRNECINESQISDSIGVDHAEITEFFAELVELGLLVCQLPTEEDIMLYRSDLKKFRKDSARDTVKKLQESSVLINHDDVEMQYVERCGGIFSLMIEMTYNCSEKCIHCYNPGATRNDNERSGRNTASPLALEDYKRVIDELNEKGLVKVCLTGGDPFSNPIVWDVIDYLWSKEIAIDIFTNGQKLVGQAKRLSAYYPRTIGISLYSNIEDVHDKITRIQGSYKRTISFIEECSDLAMPMLLKCCIMKPNVSSYFTVKDIAFKYGMTPQFDINITDSLDGDICASTYLRLPHELMEIVLRDPDLPYYIDGSKELQTAIHPTLNGRMCNAGINSLCLTPSGDIQPCCAFPMKCGNVKTHSVSEIMENPILLEWRNHRILGNTECLTHEYCTFCQLCAGNNFNSTGDFLKPSENNCFLAKERFSLNKAIAQGEDPIKGRDVYEVLSNVKISTPPLKRIKKNNG